MKTMAVIAVILSLVCCCSVHAKPSGGSEFYVATNGRDTNPGTEARPFATLERARDAIRTLKQAEGLPAGGVTLWIRGGTYHLAKTFQLTTEDSGAENAPVVYRACEGEEVRLTGGREVTGFEPVKDPAVLKRLAEGCRGKVLQADLKGQGITDFGNIVSRGFGRAVVPAGLELFFQDRPMTLARWPNDGWARIADVPAGPQGGKFTYEGDRPKHWADADDIWIHGYWTWDWADSYEKVKSIDTQTREIATEPPHGVYGYKAGKRWRALNVLEELDAPGEWYVDRKTGILYFWPPEPLDEGRVLVSLLEAPMVSLEDASYVTLRGLTFEACRGTAVEVKGGAHNLIAGCTLRNIGTVAVNFIGGTDNGVVGSDIYETGDTAIELRGGDRKTLTPGRNYAVNNHIHHFSRWSRTYRGAVTMTGVGNRAAHNLIHDAPHTAIFLHGNEQIIEFNEIHHVCMETSDAGGMYLGRDFTERGSVVRYNFLHHLGTADVRAIYLDDDASGIRVFGNVLYKARMGVCIGGGRDNVIQNNVFVDCRPSIYVDARGLRWAKPTVDSLMKERLEAMNYREPPYSERYPELLTLYDDDPGAPKYNVIERNISFGGKWLRIYSRDYEKTISIRDNLLDVDPCFVEPANMNFQLRDDSPAWKLGFKRIPMERIGLYMDEYRTTLPENGSKPSIRKLGTIDCDMVETTPVVFKGRLYRFEYVRENYKPNDTGDSYFRFVDLETGEATPSFAEGYHLGSAHVEGDTAYVYGVDIWGGTEIKAFWSKDLKKWESQPALTLPGWGIFNNSVCKGRGRYVMAFEIDKPAEETGTAFTMRFAESRDLVNWKLMPSECVFSKDRYTACPALRYLDGWYYMIYLEAKPGPTYEPHIVRSKDLIDWKSSPLNPLMRHSIEDKFIANPKLTAEEKDRIAKAVNINNSDVDLCEYKGKTIIYYSWGNQQGIEHLAEAVYDGTMAEFLESVTVHPFGSFCEGSGRILVLPPDNRKEPWPGAWNVPV